MARKKKATSSKPSDAYLMSFGDTMTTLLAFFIVLNSLAEEQTGANLHSGTGSFIRAISTFGLPGTFTKDTTARAVPLGKVGPLYVRESDDDRDPSRSKAGPDDTDNQLRVIDPELEDLERFLLEMERLDSKVKVKEKKVGDATYDLFDTLNPEPPHLNKAHSRVIAKVLSVLARPSYRVEITVWATTPKESAWSRAVSQASGIFDEIATVAKLDQQEKSRLICVGRPWMYRDERRPVLSVSVSRVAP